MMVPWRSLPTYTIHGVSTLPESCLCCRQALWHSRLGHTSVLVVRQIPSNDNYLMLEIPVLSLFVIILNVSRVINSPTISQPVYLQVLCN
jgi:hypothetical protein